MHAMKHYASMEIKNCAFNSIFGRYKVLSCERQSNKQKRSENVQPYASPQSRRTQFKPYFPNFHGIRAIAIFAVILVHVTYGHVGGVIGVDLFFFLSGFLITTLLITEQAIAGRISLAKFYARR